jgi:hypothetical protein
MKPKLYAFKREELKRYNSRNRICFVVVNSDKTEKYPANFVCVLPKHKSSIINSSTQFSREFGKENLGLARQLLTKAYKDEDDAEIRAEIQERLKILKPHKS